MNPFSFRRKPKPTNHNSKTKAAHLLVGPTAKGPKRCFKCGKPFKPGEAWRRYTSPPDPQYGSYSFGVHEKCPE
jgi:hypothetical protein